MTYGQLFERRLQLFVVCGGGAVDDLLLPARGSLAANADLGLKLL